MSTAVKQDEFTFTDEEREAARTRVLTPAEKEKFCTATVEKALQADCPACGFAGSPTVSMVQTKKEGLQMMKRCGNPDCRATLGRVYSDDAPKASVIELHRMGETPVQIAAKGFGGEAPKPVISYPQPVVASLQPGPVSILDQLRARYGVVLESLEPLLVEKADLERVLRIKAPTAKKTARKAPAKKTSARKR